jgi:hypothetical protein
MDINQKEMDVLICIYELSRKSGEKWEPVPKDSLGEYDDAPELTSLKHKGCIEEKEKEVRITPSGIGVIKKALKRLTSESNAEGIWKLETASEEPGVDINVDEMMKEYHKLYRKPIWRLVEDIQLQAMLYENIIEQIKSGKDAEEIRTRFEEFDLMPGASLPNPNLPALMQKAFDKISAYRKALVEVVKKYGGELLNELSFELEQTVSVGVNIGFPPSVSISVNHNAKTTTVRRF